MAKELAPLIDAEVLSSDKIRKELIPKPIYTKGEKEIVYNALLVVARYLQNAGMNCILDATFNTEKSRREARDKLNIVRPEHIVIVECICPEDVVISRLKARKGDFSDADISIYRTMKKVYEPVKEEHIIADTSRDPKIIAQEIETRVKRRVK